MGSPQGITAPNLALYKRIIRAVPILFNPFFLTTWTISGFGNSGTTCPISPIAELVTGVMAEQPFQVNVSDADIQLLHNKLELHRFPDELEDAGWDYGAPLSDIKRLVARWKDGYDWKKFEANLNQFPMFTRDIPVEGHDTLNIHYIHQKSTVAGAIPLLFVHGCRSQPFHSFAMSPN